MTGEIRIHCDTDPTVTASETLSVSIRETTYRLKLKIAELSARLVQNLDPLIADLIEVAGYVYAADSLVSRGGPAAARMGERWRRNFHFEIPVRNPDIWNQQSIVDALSTTLGFVSDDQYDFTFRAATNPVEFDGYFEYGQDRGMTPSSIMMFSGGLDSFAGALEEAIGHRHQTVLVTHRSSTKLAPVQRQLIKYLRDQNDVPSILHVPVTVQIADGKTRESTHRSRSSLFASLGMATAQCFGVDHVKFFENGIVSMNLPLGSQVVGSRATRSTHPETLAGFAKFF